MALLLVLLLLLPCAPSSANVTSHDGDAGFTGNPFRSLPDLIRSGAFIVENNRRVLEEGGGLKMTPGVVPWRPRRTGSASSDEVGYWSVHDGASVNRRDGEVVPSGGEDVDAGRGKTSTPNPREDGGKNDGWVPVVTSVRQHRKLGWDATVSGGDDYEELGIITAAPEGRSLDDDDDEVLTFVVGSSLGGKSSNGIIREQATKKPTDDVDIVTAPDWMPEWDEVPGPMSSSTPSSTTTTTTTTLRPITFRTVHRRRRPVVVLTTRRVVPTKTTSSPETRTETVPRGSQDAPVRTSPRSITSTGTTITTTTITTHLPDTQTPRLVFETYFTHQFTGATTKPDSTFYDTGQRANATKPKPVIILRGEDDTTVPGSGGSDDDTAGMEYSVAPLSKGERDGRQYGSERGAGGQSGAGATSAEQLSYILVGVCCAISLTCLVVVVTVLRCRKVRQRKRALQQLQESRNLTVSWLEKTHASSPPSVATAAVAEQHKPGRHAVPDNAPETVPAPAPHQHAKQLWFVRQKKSPYLLYDHRTGPASGDASGLDLAAAVDGAPSSPTPATPPGHTSPYQPGFPQSSQRSSGLDYMKKGELIYWSSNDEQLI